MKKAFLRSLAFLSLLDFGLIAAMNHPKVEGNQSNFTQTLSTFRKRTNSTEMKMQIQQHLLKTLFFRWDLLPLLKAFFTKPVNLDGFPCIYKTPWFLNDLRKNDIVEEVSTFPSVAANSKEASLKLTIEEDNLEELQKIITGENLNMRVGVEIFEFSWAPIPILHYCITKKAIKCFKFLLLNGANPELRLLIKLGQHFYNWNSMPTTIAFFQPEMMKILEERGVNKLSNPGVWEASALTHQNNLLKLFINNQDEIINFKECLSKGIEGAAKGNNLKGLKIMLPYLNEGKDVPVHSLLDAITFCNLEALRILIFKGADVNSKDCTKSTLLHHAVMKNLIEIGEFLIFKGADVNAKNEMKCTPLHYAVTNKYIKMAEMLIFNGANINSKDRMGWTPLHFAVDIGLNNITELLVSNGADVTVINQDGDTPLHFAARNNSNKACELLTSKGADVNAINWNGDTPLYYAVENDLKEVGELLISAGADLNHLDVEMNTLLHNAAATDSRKIGEVLISAGIPINTPNKYGWTPLHIAANYDSARMGELLISKGADINARDNQGQTPLHMVTDTDSIKMATLLISKGVDINAKDKYGKTPLFYAEEGSKVRELLLSKGAQTF